MIFLLISLRYVYKFQYQKKYLIIIKGGYVKKILILLSVLFLFSCDKLIEKEMDSIHRQVIKDSIDQLNIAIKGGDPIDICVYAGMLSAAYLQAKDEEGYIKAKAFEKKACENAGIPY